MQLDSGGCLGRIFDDADVSLVRSLKTVKHLACIANFASILSILLLYPLGIHARL